MHFFFILKVKEQFKLKETHDLGLFGSGNSNDERFSQMYFNGENKSEMKWKHNKLMI